MNVIRNIQMDLNRFRSRVVVVTFAILAAFGVLSLRLFYLQVIRYDELNAAAESNRTAIVPIVPNRGVIMDRNGVVLATNYSAYTLEITPSKVVAPVEEVIEQLSSIIDIQPRDKRRFKKQVEESKSIDSVPIRNRLTEEEVARFAAQRYRFPGVEIRARLFRNYPYEQLASHVIGYIGRINTSEKAKIEESEDAGNYRGTEYIGKLGVEQSYENQLHGITGVQEMETSAGGRAVRRLNSSQSVPGNSVVLSIDIKLQKLIEDLYGTRRGALVALDPKTGEVLAFVSKPTFDPNLFVDGIDADNWQALNESIDKPLLNRAASGLYPPGSVFKIIMAMAGLHKRVTTRNLLEPHRRVELRLVEGPFSRFHAVWTFDELTQAQTRVGFHLSYALAGMLMSTRFSARPIDAVDPNLETLDKLRVIKLALRTELGRLWLAATDPARLHLPLELDQIQRDIIPYRANRRALGIETCASRIEHAKELERARNAGFDLAQGFLLGKPERLEQLGAGPTRSRIRAEAGQAGER